MKINFTQLRVCSKGIDELSIDLPHGINPRFLSDILGKMAALGRRRSVNRGMGVGGGEGEGTRYYIVECFLVW